MFKVLIVDDEIYVVALIQKLIDWEKFNMEVAAVANDGITALELVKDISPDLVIVDVRMPGYDGISFMDKVREFNNDVKFIVISGHKQFDYAKGAMRNNVEDYLLKPINKDELESVISKVYDQLIEVNERKSKVRKIEKELDDKNAYIRGMLVKSIIDGRKEKLSSCLEEINNVYSARFQNGSFQMISYILNITRDSQNEARTYIFEENKVKLHNTLIKNCKDVLLYEYKNICYFLLNFDEENVDIIEKDLSCLMNQFKKQTNKFGNLSEHICCGGVYDQLDDLIVNIDEIWKCMYARTTIHSGKIIFASEVVENTNMGNVVWKAYEEKFLKSLISSDEKHILFSIKEMYSKAFYGLEEDMLLYYKLYIHIVDCIYKHFNNIGINMMEEEEFKKDLMDQYLLAGSSSDYINILHERIKSLIQDNHLSNWNESAPTVRLIKRYIEEHYQEDISLGTAAAIVNISPVYLSRLFKKNEGINFLDYLNQYRILVAKDLLKNPKCNVIEVAEKSGFNNTKYFSKIFKKNVGITPSEYKKRHMGKGN